MKQLILSIIALIEMEYLFVLFAGERNIIGAGIISVLELFIFGFLFTDENVLNLLKKLLKGIEVNMKSE